MRSAGVLWVRRPFRARLTRFEVGEGNVRLNAAAVNIDADIQAINQLRQRGADLSQVHDLYNYFLCGDEQSARRLANWVEVWGYRAKVVPPRASQGWEVRAQISIEPTPDNVFGMRGEMERLARKVGAAYDGWEVEEVRPVET